MSGKIILRLRALDSCAVSDACDQLGLENQVSTVARPLTGQATIAGRCVTVRLGPVRSEASKTHLCAAATDATDAESVIVIAHQGRTDCAGWGGNLSRAAKERGAAGTIIDGAARDIDEASTIGYPVFAAAATPRTARGRTQEHAWGETITFDGVVVGHGDYVIADSTGVVFISASRIADVLSAAEVIAATESAMAAAIATGTPVSVVMGADYEQMLD